jgi:hypothetical protein
VGRFLSEDPLFGDVASPNSLMAWGYANGNPLRYSDATGEEAAEWVEKWEKHRAAFREWLAGQLTPQTSAGRIGDLAVLTLAVELGAGLMDLGRLGEGAAEGGIKGYGKDGIRALGIALMLRGMARAGLDPANPKTMVEPGKLGASAAADAGAQVAPTQIRAGSCGSRTAAESPSTGPQGEAVARVRKAIQERVLEESSVETVELEHGTTLRRAVSIVKEGPDPGFAEPGSCYSAEGFSTAPAAGPFPVGSPAQYATSKAKLFAGEGGPAVVNVKVPKSVAEEAIVTDGEVRFEPGAGLEELLSVWSRLEKVIRGVKQ